MAVRIRLRRIGKKKQPQYRLIVADSRAPRDGRFIETIGRYNPRVEPPLIEVNAERAQHWLGVGAQPSDTARALLRKSGVLEAAGASGGASPAPPAAEVETE